MKRDKKPKGSKFSNLRKIPRIEGSTENVDYNEMHAQYIEKFKEHFAKYDEKDVVNAAITNAIDGGTWEEACQFSRWYSLKALASEDHEYNPRFNGPGAECRKVVTTNTHRTPGCHYIPSKDSSDLIENTLNYFDNILENKRELTSEEKKVFDTVYDGVQEIKERFGKSFRRTGLAKILKGKKMNKKWDMDGLKCYGSLSDMTHGRIKNMLEFLDTAHVFEYVWSEPDYIKKVLGD